MGCGTWGSFEPFASFIPGAIRFAGGPNLLEFRPPDTAGNEDADADCVFVAGLRDLCLAKSRPYGMTSEEVAAELFDHEAPPQCMPFRDVLRAATKTMTGRPSVDRIGRALRKRRGKPVRIGGGLSKLVYDDSDNNRRVWLVSDVGHE